MAATMGCIADLSSPGHRVSYSLLDAITKLLRPPQTGSRFPQSGLRAFQTSCEAVAEVRLDSRLPLRHPGTMCEHAAVDCHICRVSMHLDFEIRGAWALSSASHTGTLAAISGRDLEEYNLTLISNYDEGKCH